MIRNRMVRLAALVAVIPALAVPARANVEILPRTAVVQVSEGTTDTYYNFFSTLTATVYRQGGKAHQGVILADNTELAPNVYLLQDWAKYLGDHEVKSGLLLVGDVSDASRHTYQNGLGIAQSTVIKGNPVEISRAVAKSVFGRSATGVVAPQLAHPTDADLESAANAAVFASKNNLPLFYMTQEGVEDATLEAMKAMGIKEVVIFDATNTLPEQSLSSFGANDITVKAQIKTAQEMVARVLEGTTASTVCMMQDGARSLAAAVAAARYEGVVLRIPAETTKTAVKAYAAIPVELLRQTRKLEKPYDLADFPMAPKDGEVVESFYAYLQGLGADNGAALERVILFAQGSEYTGVPLTLDRSLVGDPRKPDQRGALIGRMPGSPQENIAFINRTSLYRGLIFANPRPKRVNMVMVAYEVENTSEDCSGSFEDPEGKAHKVNEYYGVHEGDYDDPGVYVDMKAKGYEMTFHNGRNPGPKHPVNEGADSHSFAKELREGIGYFYVSCHGGTNEIYIFDEDNGTSEAVEWGAPHWPDPSGRVNEFGNGYSASEIDADYENLHSVVGIFNACLVGGGAINYTMLKHGATASIASYISVSFDGAGMFNSYFSDQFSNQGTSIGEAFAYATARTSQIWPTGQTAGDSSLRFVLFGDPMMEYVKPGWTSPDPIQVGERIGGP